MNSFQEKILKFKRQLVNIFKFVIIVFFASVTVIYAKSITNISQTAETGDLITAQWVSDVNKKLTAPVPYTKPMYQLVVHQNSSIPSENVDKRNSMVQDAVNKAPVLGNNITNWQKACQITSGNTLDGSKPTYNNNNPIDTAWLWTRCGQQVCAHTYQLSVPIVQFSHCGESGLEGSGCKKGAFTLICMYADKR